MPHACQEGSGPGQCGAKYTRGKWKALIRDMGQAAKGHGVAVY